MEIVLNREIRTKQTTIGALHINGKFECYILEDVDRGLSCKMPLAEIKERKLKGDTAIPEGTYQVIRTFSPKFGKVLPELLNVPGYVGIRMHPGNFAKDTEGCLLPGTTRTIDAVYNSRDAFDALDKKIEAALSSDELVFITINW